jgi:electron transport complex protein RnfD
MSSEINMSTSTAEALAVSTSPHIRDEATVGSIMWKVVLALSPALMGAVYFFGYRALMLAVISMGAAIAIETLWEWLTKRPVTAYDGSAAVTGLLVAFVLPANASLGMIVTANLVGLVVGKHLFGGLGNNVWNPALIGRAWVHFCWPAEMNMSEWPTLANYGAADIGGRLTANIASADAVTQATPLNSKAIATVLDGGGERMYSLAELFFGFNRPGCLGETSVLLLAIGGAYLISQKLIKWYVPLIYIGTVGLMTALIPYGKAGVDGSWPAPWTMPVYQMMAGGLVIGAFYMATDMVTTPLSRKGQVVFALGCGVLTASIRLFGGYPEGVAFSILIMNSAVPLIDRYTQPRVYGT